MNGNPNSSTPLPVRAAELCRYFTLSEEGKKLLDEEVLPEDFSKRLIEKDLGPDAVQTIAHYLPKRQAVFWALACVKQITPEPSPETEIAVKSAERWISDPSDETRAAALRAADAADAGTPAGCTALAAYYSDGLPRTEDPKANARAWFLTAKLVASAVLLAATAEPESMKERFRTFADSGLEIIRKSKR